jgi:hypothetical protein
MPPATRRSSGSSARHLRALASSALLLLAALDATAANRCILAGGRVVYTDASCESIGGKADRPVRNELSVVPLPGEAKPGASKPVSRGSSVATPGAQFRKAPNAPVLTVCYDPANARQGIGVGEVESAIRGAVALWNAGCNVNYEYLGVCADSTARDQRPIDYKVWWASWDDSLRVAGDASKTVREHAIAAASPSVGVALNRDVEGAAFQRQWRRSIVHEFGHVVGIGHSGDRRDIMYSGGLQQTPTEYDLAACNAAVAQRFGVRSP